MPRPRPNRTAAPTPEPPGDQPLARLAERLADDGGELPGGLEPDQELVVIDLARRRLRDRLFRYIARQIALDLRRPGGTSPGKEPRS
jgi:hypothetical protein